jgi:Tol biopolymer transport system component
VSTVGGTSAPAACPCGGTPPAAARGARDQSLDVGAASLWIVNADGSGKTQLTAEGKGPSPDWSPDGTGLSEVSGIGTALDPAWRS